MMPPAPSVVAAPSGTAPDRDGVVQAEAPGLSAEPSLYRVPSGVTTRFSFPPLPRRLGRLTQAFTAASLKLWTIDTVSACGPDPANVCVPVTANGSPSTCVITPAEI